MHGVEQLGELIETLPVLAGVLLALHDGFPQFLNVRHPNIVEHRLALQAVLWHCGREREREREREAGNQKVNIWDRDKHNVLSIANEEAHSLHFKLSRPGREGRKKGD